ncbi:MAG TPA: hypothetical protein DF712_13500 [Balneola sp.]|nr:hypothetical protein [Balneola sp.]|tara:strand:+ start:355 stop:741 length:387 start_codon:yes stop_codon:yes gene_type:complete
MKIQQTDRLAQMFLLRKDFMKSLSKEIPDAIPENIDITSKEGQKYLRDLALHGVEEMFEALQHLKNWKSHRKTEIKEKPNSDEFLEEIVDAFNYFFSLIILAGFDENDLFAAYLEKDTIINDRLKNGY